MYLSKSYTTSFADSCIFKPYNGDEILPRLRARQTRNVISRSIVAEVTGKRETRQ